MPKVVRAGALLVSLLVGLTGCGESGVDEASDQPVSGRLGGTSFTFVSGYAGVSSSDPNVRNVYLFPEQPAPGTDPWDATAYANRFPYVSFAFESSLAPGRFSIATYAGIADSDDIGVSGWLSDFDNVLLDSGTLTIDTFAATVSGSVIGRSRDESSELDGKFEVPLRP